MVVYIVTVCVPRFPRPRFLPLFFFFFVRVNSNLTWVHCSCTVQHCLYTVQHCLCTVYVLKKLKMGPTILFTHLKIILRQCFQFSVFSNNKLNPNRPIVTKKNYNKFLLRTIIIIKFHIQIKKKEKKNHILLNFLTLDEFL